MNKDDIRVHIRYDLILQNIFKICLAALTTRLEYIILLPLSDRFALVFGRLTSPETHYVAVYTTFTSKNDAEYRAACLAISQLKDETMQGAEIPVRFYSSSYLSLIFLTW